MVSTKSNRRRFLQIISASVAAGTFSGCWGRAKKPPKLRSEKREVKSFFKSKEKALKKQRKEEENRLKEENQGKEKTAEEQEKEKEKEKDEITKRDQLRAKPLIERKYQMRGLIGFSTKYSIFTGENVEEIAKKLYKWGVNAVWPDKTTLANKDLIDALHAWSIQVYATVELFNGWRGRNRPIRSDGTPLQSFIPGHWYQGSCPNQPNDISRALGEIQLIAKKYDVDGIWFDGLRYPVFWSAPKPNADMTCFDQVCQSKFQNYAGTTIPKQYLTAQDQAEWILKNHADEWVDFKKYSITSLAGKFAKAAKEVKPNLKIGLFTVPWRRRETRGNQMNAIERIVGQDYPGLANEVDIISPMVYHRMCGETVEWIGGIVDWIASEVKGIPVWPIVQSYGEPRCTWNAYRLSTEEFADAMETARGGASGGVAAFTMEYLLKEEKLEAMVKNYNSV